MKLIVTAHGDESVGIWSDDFEIECPFEKEDVESESLEFFRDKIKELYKEFCDMGIRVEYDFDKQREIQEEADCHGRDYDNEAKQYQDDLRESDAPTPYDP